MAAPGRIPPKIRHASDRALPSGSSVDATDILAAIAGEPDIERPEPLTAPAAVTIRRALLSVSDKRGIVDFANGLAALGVELVSTGGTAAALADAGLEVRAIEDFTGFPEIMDGRVKTLHPRLYAGLLAVRDDPAHMAALGEHEIEEVDLVCVNLYPFERAVASRLPPAQIIENIDIGGPTMIRAAAKNHAFAAVVTSPESYDAVLDELRGTGGQLSMPTRESLAAEAFAYTARYDTAVARWFAEKSEDFPPLHVRAYEKVTDLPYGENPHQRAAYYRQVGARTHILSGIDQHHGKQLSFNNLVDLDSARAVVREFDTPACVIVKHNNPCGAAVGDAARQAYERAFATDPLSAFGGVIAFNRPVDAATAERLAEQFVEVLIAPGFEQGALEILQRKPSIRILEDGERRAPLFAEPEIKQVMGGLLVQDRDVDLADRTEMEVVTERHPSDDEWRDLMFAWKVCMHVRSNAIVLARGEATAGIGAGQMSRVDSVRLAVDKSRLESLAGAVLASDAFFPFSDGPEIAIGAGVTAIIQPGGSRRDPEVVEAADAAGIAMVFTSRRHFRH
ncbi:MAG: bifunctional phosphoribosylaminoimidazolecarboxamide formyltransferase/IMP cyclohydrolase [Solirubrobacteraceae bacterium]|nr:bifunctional phosphoribosylaminoimidazolecarboxamide formyltransferase/IMP cyclohydrolase [Solirubrobacteraceae bacterium]